MAQKNSNPKLLAHWRFTAEQWREFSYYENLESEHRSFVDLRMVIIFGAAILGFISVIALVKGGLSAFLLVGGGGILFVGFCYLIHRLVRLDAKQKLQSVTGDVKITTRNVYVNDVLFFDWGKGWGLPLIEKDYLYIGDRKLLLLNFSCRRIVRRSRDEIKKHCMVPVELGKESEADAVIKELTETWSQKFQPSVEESK
ncbi:MAG: hypothetical protein LH614_16420 [Pyrinomonadaceae bacterium]|nr:hypothetical protein [Pyrinomonadaceae bacterium]